MKSLLLLFLVACSEVKQPPPLTPAQERAYAIMLLFGRTDTWVIAYPWHGDPPEFLTRPMSLEEAQTIADLSLRTDMTRVLGGGSIFPDSIHVK